MVLSEGVSPNWTHQAALSPNDTAFVSSLTQGRSSSSRRLSPSSHTGPVDAAPILLPQTPVPLRAVPPPQLEAHYQPTRDQPHLPTTPPSAQPCAGDFHTMVANSLHNHPSQPQATVSAGSALNGTLTAASVTTAPFPETTYLHPRPPPPPYSHPVSTWMAPSSHMDQSSPSTSSTAAPETSSSGGTEPDTYGRLLQPATTSHVKYHCEPKWINISCVGVGVSWVYACGGATLTRYTPSLSLAPVDVLKRELVWKLKVLSCCNNHSLLEEVRRRL